MCFSWNHGGLFIYSYCNVCALAEKWKGKISLIEKQKEYASNIRLLVDKLFGPGTVEFESYLDQIIFGSSSI